MQLTIGIDVSKDWLDAYRFSDGQHLQVTNDRAGTRTLLGWIGRADPPLAVFEATGAYHRQLEAALGAGRVPFAKVNPRQARRFAEATGRWPRPIASTPPCWRGWEPSWTSRSRPRRTRP